MTKTARAVGVVSAVALVSKVTGFAREMAIAHGFGVGMTTDAFRVAQGIPNIFFTVVGTGLATVLVPVITRILRDEGQVEAYSFVRRMVSLVIATTGIVSVLLGSVLAPGAVRMMAPGFSAEALKLSVALTRVLVPGLVLTTVGSVVAGLNHSLGEFAVPAARHLPANLLIIAAALAMNRTFGIWAVVWATVIGLMGEVLVQLPRLYERGFRFGWELDTHDPVVRHVAALMLPVIVGTALTQVNTLVSRMFASMLPVGSISVLEYSSRLVSFVTGIIVTAVATVALSRFSAIIAQSQTDRLGSAVTSALCSLNAVVFPMATGLMMLRQPIIRFVYERGAFTAEATGLTARALLFASVGLIGIGMREVSARGFYALQDTRTPMINGIVGMCLNIGLIFLFVSRMNWGVSGMALAASLSASYAGIVLTALLHRKIPLQRGSEGHGLAIRALTASLWRTALASSLMGVALTRIHLFIGRLISGAGFVAQALQLGMTIGLGGVVYVVAMTLLGSEEAKQGWQVVGHTFSWLTRRRSREA